MYQPHTHKPQTDKPAAKAPEGPYVITDGTIGLEICVPGRNGVLMKVAACYTYLNGSPREADAMNKSTSLAVAKLFVSAKTANTACQKALERLKAIGDTDEDLQQLLQEALTMAEVA